MPNWKKVIVSGSDASLNSLSVATNVVAQSFTGSLFGTASYVTQALSSSFASTASYVNHLIQDVLITGSLNVSGSGNFTNNLYVTGGLLVTQSYISTVDYIDFTRTVVPAHNEGRIHWIDDTKTLNVDTDVNNFYIELGHQNVVRVNNQNAFTLTKGTIVYIDGENGQRPTVATASWTDDSLSATTLGFVAQDINSGQNGYVISRGIIRDINTNAFAPGTMLFLSASGQYTSTVPVAPLHQVRLGRTITQATAGTVYVDIMNGYEIGELHDVLETNRQNGDLIIFDSGSRVYKNSKILSGSYGVSGSLNVSEGITGSLFGTASLATSASYYPIKVSGSTIYSADPATSGFNTTGAVIIGPNSVGQNSTNSQFAVMVGAAAGQNATTSQYAVMIGTSAGNGASNSEYGVMLGRWAGSSATNASSSVMVGREAGRNATNTTLSTFVGPYAGFGATNARSSTFIGNQAGYNASSANDSVFVGTNAGYGATAAVQSLFYGPNAGFQASAATLSTFIGNESGYNAISASYGVFIGNVAGQNATSASFSTFIGRSAGQAATKANQATFIGSAAGAAATFANNATIIGNAAGENAASASYSILIGNYAGSPTVAANTIGSYNTVIGTGISVPVNATRALNIGGLIFGTGSYATANLDAFSGSANGRVGINQPLPQKEFDISGSLRVSRLSTSLTAPVTSGTTKMVITDSNGDISFDNIPTGGTTFPYTGSAIISGSLQITGSLDVSQGITGSLFGTSSYAITASYALGGLGSTTNNNYYFGTNRIDQSGGTNDTYGILTGSVNGANTLFTVSKGKYISGSLKVYVNGQLLTQGTAEDWYESTPVSGTFYFVSASLPQSGDQVTAEYIEAVTTDSYTTSVIAKPVSGSTLTLSRKTETFISGGLTSGSGSNFTVALGTQTTGEVNEYILIFKTGASVPTVYQPGGIAWRGQTPVLSTNETWTFVYEYVQITTTPTWEIYGSAVKNV